MLSLIMLGLALQAGQGGWTRPRPQQELAPLLWSQGAPVRKVSVTLQIGSHGTIRRCATTPSGTAPGTGHEYCRRIAEVQFDPARDPAGIARPSRYTATYTLSAQPPAGADPATPPVMVAPPESTPARTAPAEPPFPAVPVPAEKAKPSGNPGSWLTDADYPVAALRAEQKGKVKLRLLITPAGQVERCEITASSGVPVLDNAACDVLEERGTFTPARDTQGKAVTGIYATSLTWVMPDALNDKR